MIKRIQTAAAADSSDDLIKAGLKVTTPRRKILEILESSEHPHLMAEEIYQRLGQGDKDVGIATVYLEDPPRSRHVPLKRVASSLA